MKIILLTAAALIFSFAACARNQPKDKTKNKKVEIVKTERSKTEPLQVGEVAPDFTLLDQNGKKVTLSEAKNPVLLVFYRGYW